MNKRENLENENDTKRLFSIKEASIYIGLGKNNTRAWCESIGAIKKYKRRILIDRTVVDRALDEKAEEI